MYVIRNVEKPQEEFWSNEHGWSGLSEATVFSDAERPALNLPVGGEWVERLKIDFIQFSELVIEQNGKRVLWEYLGEGLSGDYDENDSEDCPLLRFSCYAWDREDEAFREIDNSSYCTRLPVSTPRMHLLIAADVILEALEQPSPKRRLEELSWFCPDDFSKF